MTLKLKLNSNYIFENITYILPVGKDISGKLGRYKKSGYFGYTRMIYHELHCAISCLNIDEIHPFWFLFRIKNSTIAHHADKVRFRNTMDVSS